MFTQKSFIAIACIVALCFIGYMFVDNQPQTTPVPKDSSEPIQDSFVNPESEIEYDISTKKDLPPNTLNLFEDYYVHGQVLDKELGHGVSDLTVFILTWDESLSKAGALPNLESAKQVVTDVDGFFSIPKLRLGTYGLLVKHKQYIQDRFAYKHVISKENYKKDIVLKVEQGGLVIGAITAEGEPIQNHPVYLHFGNRTDNFLETITDSSGMYTFEGLESSQVNLSSTHSDKKHTFKALVKPGKVTEVNFPFGGRDSFIDGSIFPFYPDRYYEVHIVNTAGVVTQGEVYDDGTFLFADLSPDVYRVEIKSTQWQRLVSRQDMLVRTYPNNSTPCNFYSSPRSYVHGQVTNREKDEELTVFVVKDTIIKELNNTVYAQLQKSALAVSAKINKDGEFIFPELESGKYTLFVKGNNDRMVYAQLLVEEQFSNNTEESNADFSLLMKLDNSWTHILKD